MHKELTAPEVVAMLSEWGGVDDSADSRLWLAETTAQMNRWIQRGDGIAVYENQDMGHPELGDKRFVSYGSAAAQLETDTPPGTLPDGIGGTVNWRYQLKGMYRGAPLEVQ